MAETAEFGPRKTIFILAIVAGCFAVLWPKIFYPMLTASVISHPSSSDVSTCCDVIFESDVNTVDIMQEMCQNIMRHHQVDPRVRDALKTGKPSPQSASLCRDEVLARCGIDLSSFLAQRERLGKSYKQVLEELRSFNGSLCLKMNFGVPLSQLGTPHLIRYHILMPHSTIRQERRTPPHAGGLHPALRERGRAIPSSHIVPKVKDRPDHVTLPKMRPPMGGAGHVVPPPKGNGTMGIIMPLYTLGIVLFFLYTIVKVLRKNADGDVTSEYPGTAAESEFRKMVFSPETLTSAVTGTLYRRNKERSFSPPRPAPTLEELKDLDAAPKSNGLAGAGSIFKDIATSRESETEEADKELEDVAESSPTVKVVGMEMTTSCEGGQKWSRPNTPVVANSHSHLDREKTPPKPIYLEGSLPSQCELLVTDSKTQAEQSETDVEAPVVLSGKMTLSLISLDQIPSNTEINDDKVLPNGFGAAADEHEIEEKCGEMEMKNGIEADIVKENGVKGDEVEEKGEVEEEEEEEEDEEEEEGEEEGEEEVEIEIEEEEVEVEEEEEDEEEVDEEDEDEDEDEEEDEEENDEDEEEQVQK